MVRQRNLHNLLELSTYLSLRPSLFQFIGCVERVWISINVFFCFLLFHTNFFGFCLITFLSFAFV